VEIGGFGLGCDQLGHFLLARVQVGGFSGNCFTDFVYFLRIFLIWNLLGFLLCEILIDQRGIDAPDSIFQGIKGVFKRFVGLFLFLFGRKRCGRDLIKKFETSSRKTVPESSDWRGVGDLRWQNGVPEATGGKVTCITSIFVLAFGQFFRRVVYVMH
jgi:hypothetical protein